MVEYWPPDVITNYGIQVLQDGIEPQIIFESYDGQTVFYLLGGCAPIPGVTEGVVLSEGAAGLHAPFNQLSNKGARQVGTTWTDTVYDATQMTLKVKATARTRDRLRTVISRWMAAWSPEKKGTLSWTTPDSGQWWCTARLNRAPVEKLDYFPGVREQEFTWTVHNSKAMWSGPDSTSQFNFAHHDATDNFNRTNLANLGSNWSQTYTAGATGTCGTDGSRAIWTPSGTASAGVINRWLGRNAVQTITVGGDPTSFTSTYNGVATSSIAFPASAASVQSALQSLLTIGSGNVSVATPVLFDAVGTGASMYGTTATSLSWTHTVAGNYVLVFVSVDSGAVSSVTFGGTSMTLLSSQAFDNVSGNGYLYVYGLASPPSGGQTVSVTLSGAAYATGNSVTYSNVASVAAQTSVYGSGNVCSMNTPSGSDVVVQAFGSQLSALAQTGVGALRYHGYSEDLTGIFNFAGLLIEDGVDGNEFSASLPVAQSWAGVEVVLTATTAATNGPYAVTFTGGMATQKVLPLTGAATPSTGTYVSVAQTVAGMSAVSATDNQIISAQFGEFYTWPFNDGAFVDLWARWDGNQTSPTGIRMRVAVGSITLSRFNAGTKTDMTIAPLPVTPFPWDTYSFVCGTPTNSRIYQLQLNGITLYQYTEVDSGSALGPYYRNSGFGMTAGTQYNILTNTWSQAAPPTVDNWTFDDNIIITQSGTMPLTNFGDLEEFPDFLVYGPGTFTFGDGPGADPTISFGPLADNQIALIRTDPSYRGVYDLSFAASQQVLNGFQSFVESLFSLAFNYNIPPLVSWFESLFGITPQQGDMYSLLNGRWSKGVPARPTSGVPPTYEWSVTITDGDANSKIIAAITPRRRWPE